MEEELKSLIGRILKEVPEGKLDARVIGFTNYKSRYAVLKPGVTVEAELTNGKVVKIDVTDYFEKEIK